MVDDWPRPGGGQLADPARRVWTGGFDRSWPSRFMAA